MAVGRCLFLALVGGLLLAPQLSAQDATGTIRGRVVDAASQQPLSSVNVVIVGTTRGAVSQNDGSYLLVNVTPGTQTVRSSRIGYTPQTQTVTVTAGGSATADFSLQAQAVVLGEIVSIGYGTQKRQAITGSVAVVNADDANKGVITNAQQMLEGRVAGVNVTSNNGEPGAGSQIRIRGGTSISGSNDPLYVIDGVPIDNTAVDPAGFNTGNSGGDAPVRSPLNLLNPADIETITVLKDASATAIYGSRGANGVVLIETKKGSSSGNNSEYEFYAATSSPYKYLDVLSGSEYRAFLQQQIPAGGDTVWTRRLAAQGNANTNWERELTRTATTMNHNLSFAGGGTATRYRASLNYLDQDGIVLSSGLQRVQGRINGTHNALNDKLRLGVNLTAAQNKNDYLQYEQQEGFEGGAFQNMIQFNPTRPVYVFDTVTRKTVFYEIGPGAQSARNPVAMALQVQDQGTTNRVLGNASADLDLLSFLTGRVNVGVDRSQGLRETYLPRVSALGANFKGLARQANRDNTSKTLQTLLTFHRPFDTYGGTHDVEVVGGYEWSQYNLGEFGAQAQDFLTDFTGYNNLGGGANLVRPFSFREESRLISFFGRANWALGDRYYLTGVIRRDGSSRFGPNNQWAVFPAISGAWRVSQEGFMKNGPLSDLRLRAGYGLQGNNAGSAYAWRQLLEPTGANYPFGGVTVTGVQPTRVANPDLRWEQTAQSNVALDYGFMDNRFTGTVEYYVKNTKDLLLDVTVPTPLPVLTRTENIGRLSNKGVEFNLDGRVWERPNMTWAMGLIFSSERNKIEELGGGRTSIATGDVSGQGQSGQKSQRIMKGEALGTFWGPVYTGVDAAGKQQFQCVTGSDVSCVAGKTTNKDKATNQIIGNANPDFSLGLHSTLNWNKFDFSFLIHSEQGRDVFNNTALVYSTKGNALQDKNFLKTALSDPIGIKEPAIYSSRWIEDGSFTRLQNVTLGYTFDLPYLDRIGGGTTAGRGTRVYLSGDNLLLITGYDGYDPEVHTQGAGLATRGIDNLVYPRPRTITGGFRVAF
jgi:TonB-dependent starch-binding outer membrane protein SusC